MDKKIKLTQKRERSLISTKTFSDKIGFYSGVIYCIIVIYIIFKYYGAFIDYAFTPPPPASVYDYTQSQPTFWRAVVNRFLFERPKPKNDVFVLGWSEKIYFWNMGDLSDRAKSLGFYDALHFRMTWARMLDKFQGALSGPDNVFIFMKKHDPYYQEWCSKIYQYSRANMWEWWPVVESDEFELKLRYKWFHNYTDLPIYYFSYYCIDPIVDVFFGWPYRYFSSINFKEDFTNVVRDANQHSVILCPIIEFIVKIKDFKNNFCSGLFIYDIWYFINKYLFSRSIWGPHFYCWIVFGFEGRGWDIFFYCITPENILYFLDFCRIYILNILSFLVLKLFKLFGFIPCLNNNFELILVNNLFFLFFLHLFLNIFSITILNKRFWARGFKFLKYLFFMWDSVIFVFIAIFFIKMFRVAAYPLIYLWTFFLKECLEEKTVISLFIFMRRKYNKFLWYKFLIFHICVQEIFVKEPFFTAFWAYCHEYRGPFSFYINLPSFYILYYLRKKLLGLP